MTAIDHAAVYLAATLGASFHVPADTIAVDARTAVLNAYDELRAKYTAAAKQAAADAVVADLRADFNANSRAGVGYVCPQCGAGGYAPATRETTVCPKCRFTVVLADLHETRDSKGQRQDVRSRTTGEGDYV